MFKKKIKLTLLKNAFRTVWRSKTQLLGIMSLVFLATTIFTTFSITRTRISANYNNLIHKSNIHDFIGDFDNDELIQTDQSKSSQLGSSNINIELEQQVLKQIALSWNSQTLPSSLYNWNRIEWREFKIANDTRTWKINAYSKTRTIDKLIISKGSMFPTFDPNKESRYVVISSKFAENNDIKIGDIIRFQNDNKGSNILVSKDVKDLNNSTWERKYKNFNWFKVNGFGTTADMIAPILDKTTAIPNQTTGGIAYVDPTYFGLVFDKTQQIWNFNSSTNKFTTSSNQDVEIYYVGKFNANFYQLRGSPSIDNGISYINTSLINGVVVGNNKYQFHNTSNQNNPSFFKLNDKNYDFSARTYLIQSVLNSFNLIVLLLLAFILSITAVATIMVTKKRIETSRCQIGILKASGCRIWSIAWPYVVYPLYISLVGGTLGFLAGISLQFIPIHIFSNYFNLNYGGFSLDWHSWVISIIVNFVFISIFVSIVLGVLLLEKPISLIYNLDILNSSSAGIGLILKNLAKKTSFKNRLKVSMFTSSLGKMSVIFLTMLTGSIIMTIAITGPKIIKDNYNASYYGDKYQSAFYYNLPSWNDPMSFYRTYNEDLSPWQPQQEATAPTGYSFTPSLKMLMDNFSNNNIDSQYYTPNPNIIDEDVLASSLQNLSWRNVNTVYNSNINKYVKTPTVYSLAKIIAEQAWPDYKTITNNKVIKTLLPEPTESVGLNYNKSKPSALSKTDLDNAYNTFRTFYIKYRHTINMTINPILLFRTPPSGSTIYQWENFKHDTEPEKQYFLNLGTADDPQFYTDFELKQVEIKNSQKNYYEVGDYKYPNIDSDVTNLLASQISNDKLVSYTSDLVDWFNVLFIYRQNLAEILASYSLAPYYVRENTLKAYLDGQVFNTLFNINPYNAENDMLGTLVPLNVKNNKFNLLGIPKFWNYANEETSQNLNPLVKKQYGSNFLSLSSGKKSLNNLLYQSDPSPNITPIIINKSAAIKLDLSVGDEVSWNVLERSMEGSFKDDNGNKIDWPKLPATAGQKPDLSKWSYQNPDSAKTGYLNQSFYGQGVTYDGVAPFAVPLLQASDPTKSLKAVSTNETFLRTNQVSTKFKIVGIHNSYGQLQGYISQNNANKLMHYDDSRDALFILFKTIWGNATSYANILNHDKLQTDGINAKALNHIQNANSYQDLQPGGKDADARALSLFNACFPVYDYKLSLNPTLTDLVNGATVSNPYGDYTPLALTGGKSSDPNSPLYAQYGTGSVRTIYPLNQSRQLLAQLNEILDVALIMIIIIALIISFSTIMLSTNLIISENERYISTLKVIGYSDFEITEFITGMYSVLIVGAFAIGFPIGWYILRFIINYLAMHSSWILPLIFVWWLPLVIAGIVFGVYIFTFIISFYYLKKQTAIMLLNRQD